MALTKITTNVITDSAVTSAKIASGAVGTSDIADSNVTTAKIADGAVTSAKLDPACNAPTASKFASAPAFSAFQNAAQTIGTTTYAKITLQSEEYDTNNCFDTTLSRFTPNVPGYYQVNGGFTVASSSSAGTASVWKNGSLYRQGQNTVSSGYTVSTVVYLNGTTDYVELYGYITTGQNTTANQIGCYFNGVLVKPS